MGSDDGETLVDTPMQLLHSVHAQILLLRASVHACTAHLILTAPRAALAQHVCMRREDAAVWRGAAADLHLPLGVSRVRRTFHQGTANIPSGYGEHSIRVRRTFHQGMANVRGAHKRSCRLDW